MHQASPSAGGSVLAHSPDGASWVARNYPLEAIYGALTIGQAIYLQFALCVTRLSQPVQPIVRSSLAHTVDQFCSQIGAAHVLLKSFRIANNTESDQNFPVSINKSTCFYEKVSLRLVLFVKYGIRDDAELPDVFINIVDINIWKAKKG